jgi:hypothetical protein
MENIIQENVTLRGIVSKQNDTIKLLEKENTELKTAITRIRIDRAKEQRETLMLAARLPEPVRAKLHEAFATSTDNAGLKEAINVEKRGVR